MALREHVPLSPASGDEDPLWGSVAHWVVANLEYQTSSGFRGRTDVQGGFYYRAGDSIRFKIGKLLLGESQAAASITLLDIVPGAMDLSDQRVVKLLQVLHALSVDHDPFDRVQIPELAHSRLLQLPDTLFLSEVANIETDILGIACEAPRPALVLPEVALARFAKVLAALESRRIIDGMPQVRNIAIGGNLKTCSSCNGEAHCTEPWGDILAQDPAFSGLSADQIQFGLERHRPSFTYSIDAQRIAAWTGLPPSLVRPDVQETIANRLQERLRSSPEGVSRLLFDEFDGAPRAPIQLQGSDEGAHLQAPITAGLNIAEVAAVRETFVDRLPTSGTKRKMEVRSVAFLADMDSVDIYREFVRCATNAAGGRVPRVGLVTASADNPFNDRDVHYYALKSAGADVVWLPFSGGLRHAIDSGDCSNVHIHYTAFANTGSAGGHFHMDMLFPDLAEQQRDYCANGGTALNAQLQRLNGIFFSGGDQSRHLESFISRDGSGFHARPSPQLQVLRERFQAGRMVVAGTSAGDSIQSGGSWRGKPVPMIGGGESLAALANGFAAGHGPVAEGSERTGSFYPAGGLGFFNFGPLDSHFSIRAREGRLIRLVKDSGMDYGFGVDENTALVVSGPGSQGHSTMTVLGEGGVFIVDVRDTDNEATRDGPFQISGVRIHYVTAGDRILIDATGHLCVQLSVTKPLLAENASSPVVLRHSIQDYGSANFLRMTRAMGSTGATSALGTTKSLNGANGTDFDFRVTRTSESEFRGVEGGSISYSNLALEIRPSLRVP